MPGPARSLPDAFSPGAIALNPRALVVRAHRPALADVPAVPDVAVVYDPRALPVAERAALGELASARLAPSAEPGSTDEILVCSRDDLEQAAGRLPAAALLLDALAQAERPPAPPRVMGVINVTPDSFSDAGRFLDPEHAIEHGLTLEAEGADLLDVGGESTRPGADPVSAGVELERVLPVIEGLSSQARIPISIDTTKASVARSALDVGATLVNDVSAGTADEAMLALVAERDVDYVAMHAQGCPDRMQADPSYADAVAEVARFLRERAAACWKAGLEPSRIVLDPGIGFGKRLGHNLALMRRLAELRSLGRPLLLGVSRKSFIGHLSGAEKQEDWKALDRQDRPQDRLGGTAAAVAACVAGGAEILRVHDVRVMAEAIRVAHALARSTP